MTVAFRSEIREITGSESGDENLLFQLLTEGIARLLNEPGEKLFQILYRLDVSESKIQVVLKNFTPEKWPGELAKLILEREKERQFWRKRYRENTGSDATNKNEPEHRQ